MDKAANMLRRGHIMNDRRDRIPGKKKAIDQFLPSLARVEIIILKSFIAANNRGRKKEQQQKLGQ